MFKEFLLGCTCLTTAGVAAAHADGPVLPAGGAFSAGGGEIRRDGGSLTIDQSSVNAVMTWRDFSVGASGSVHFNNGAGATLNKVTGGVKSRIDGKLSAT
uniref:two-partner secretion domain-containing protein n=1 Tax=uncultured Parvibaculum sp. TaxID=291828 RepID=UPI0030DC4398